MAELPNTDSTTFKRRTMQKTRNYKTTRKTWKTGVANGLPHVGLGDRTPLTKTPTGVRQNDGRQQAGTQSLVFFGFYPFCFLLSYRCGLLEDLGFAETVIQTAVSL